MEKLEEVYKASQALMQECAANHQRMIDYCHALRFLLMISATEETPFTAGIQQLIDYQENLRRVATSYHKAVGEALKASHAQ